MKLLNLQRIFALIALILSFLYMFYESYYMYIYSEETLLFLGYGPGGLLMQLPGWVSWLIYISFTFIYISIILGFKEIKFIYLLMVLLNLSLVFIPTSAAYTNLDIFMGNVIYLCDGILLFSLFYSDNKSQKLAE